LDLTFNLGVLKNHLLYEKVQKFGRVKKRLLLFSQAMIRIFCVGINRQGANQRNNK
jgi:hypothetical protein